MEGGSAKVTVVNCINIGHYISHGGYVECHLVLNRVHYVG